MNTKRFNSLRHVLVLAVFVASAAGANPIEVPKGSGVDVDGVVGDDEWADAAHFVVEGSASVLLKSDGESLLLAYRGFPKGAFGFGCVFVLRDDAVHVLHASAQLGSAVYRAQGEAGWGPDSEKYAWKKPERMWKEEGWMANTNPQGAQQEFRISFEALGALEEPREVRLAWAMYWQARRMNR